MQIADHQRSKCAVCHANRGEPCRTLDGRIAERVHFGRPGWSDRVNPWSLPSAGPVFIPETRGERVARLSKPCSYWIADHYCGSSGARQFMNAWLCEAHAPKQVGV